MAAEHVAQALMSMDDPEIRRRVGEGDFAALGEVDLTPQEQALLSGATPVLPDGHPSKASPRDPTSRLRPGRFVETGSPHRTTVAAAGAVAT